MLVRLYDLPPAPASALSIRKPLGPEHEAVAATVARLFGVRWASEARVALANRPVSLLLAVQAQALCGFACYDATARGMFGPIGIAPQVRGAGLGRALLLAALHDMRGAGYAYAVVGAVGAAGFFARVAGAREIEGSSPGPYRDLLAAPAEDG